MKVINFENEKDKKEYGIKSLLRDVKEIHEDEGIEVMVVIYKKKSGRLGVGTTTGNNAEIVGLFELAKLDYIDDVFD